MKRLVIANRGEIARRVLRTAREQGFEVALLCAPDDADGVALADVPPENRLAVNSYLDVEDVVRACREWKADGVHPGYGFLSENSSFAAAVEAAGLVFVGPTAEQMQQLGDKERAKRLAQEAEVPTLNAVFSEDLKAQVGQGQDWAVWLEGKGIKAPWLVKASGGGGGRGMRVVERPGELEQAVSLASQEALAGFGNAAVFIERYLKEARHVEVQVFGDGQGGGIALGERECSLQRRHQKLVEEAPSPVVGEALRQKLGEAALRLVRLTKYRGAGTVEFLLTAEEEFFFLEMNTRLQVEHPVTEEVFQCDLVAAQLQLAWGQWPTQWGWGDAAALSVSSPQGHSIEVRVLAENPQAGFVPTPGRLLRYDEPPGAATSAHSGLCRFESGLRPDARVNPSYDSMVAKVITAAPTRAEAVAKLQRSLSGLGLDGFQTNVDFLKSLMAQPAFHRFDFHTQWVEAHLDSCLESCLQPGLERLLEDPSRVFALRDLLLGSERVNPRVEHRPSVFQKGDFRAVLTGLKTAGSGAPCVGVGVRLCGLAVESWALELQRSAVGRRADLGPLLIAAAHGEGFPIVVSLSPRSELFVSSAGAQLCFSLAALEQRERGSGSAGGEIVAPMPGQILEIKAQLGDTVQEGQVIVVMESMKMQLEVQAPGSGVLAQVGAGPGTMVEAGEVLATLEEEKA